MLIKAPKHYFLVWLLAGEELEGQAWDLAIGQGSSRKE